jgi:hypothetical protein
MRYHRLKQRELSFQGGYGHVKHWNLLCLGARDSGTANHGYAVGVALAFQWLLPASWRTGVGRDICYGWIDAGDAEMEGVHE